jgi:hypothetical protein
MGHLQTLWRVAHDMRTMFRTCLLFKGMQMKCFHFDGLAEKTRDTRILSSQASSDCVGNTRRENLPEPAGSSHASRASTSLVRVGEPQVRVFPPTTCTPHDLLIVQNVLVNDS